MRKRTITLADLIVKTPNNLRVFKYDKNYQKIPESVIKYNPAIWEESDGIWHTLLGSLPEDCICTLGTTPEESMEEFDKELNEVLQPDGTIKFLSFEERRKLHQEVGHKIDKIRKKIFDQHFGREFSSSLDLTAKLSR